MSTYVISDIHGCNDAFRKALKAIKLKKTDKLILLGDLIDKGSDSKGVLDTVLLLLEHGFDVTCLKGNHEQMFLDSFSDISVKVNWLRNGGTETLSSFLTSNIDLIPKLYIDFIRSFKLFVQVDNFYLVHAGFNLSMENPFSDEKSMLWMRDMVKFRGHPWLKNRHVIHGHNPTHLEIISKDVNDKSEIICIDNGCFLSKEGFGKVCVFNLEKFEAVFI